ncbi:MAG: hypothetical protein K0V04_05650 [Deltaproteobacteria bacterium]|nr:hypothetical protein [Deltaproteobacteria bacterium]
MTTRHSSRGDEASTHALVHGEDMRSNHQQELGDEALIRAFVEQQGGGPPGDPPHHEDLWAAARGEADPNDVAALVDRMPDDPALAEDWRLAAEFSRAAAQEELDTGTDPPTELVAANDGGGLRWIGVVALVAAAALLVLAWPRDQAAPYASDASEVRGGGGAIAAVQGAGDVARDELVLEWSAVPNVVRYELYVGTDELQVLFEDRTLTDPRQTISGAALADVPAGAQLLWRVEAVRADGERIVSETFVATVR